MGGAIALYTGDIERQLLEKFQRTFPFLDEKLRRLIAASEAIALGYGGIVMVSRASGLSEPTVRNGMLELEDPQAVPRDRIRRPGATVRDVRNGGPMHRPYADPTGGPGARRIG